MEMKELQSIVREAGEAIMAVYQKQYEQGEQEEFPVTDADLASDKLLRARLAKYEGVGLLSEEDKESKTYLEYESVIIIDPIDGTKDYVHKTGDFSVMLAVVTGSEPVLGIVYKPNDDTMYFAEKGKGAFVTQNGETNKLAVSPEAEYTNMKLVTSRFHIKEPEQILKDRLGVGAFEKRGSAGIKMSLIAAGEAHIYINTSGKTGEWDSAPGSLIVHEAGGTVTDVEGNPLVYKKDHPYDTKGFVVSSGVRHGEIVKMLSSILKE